MQAKNLDHFSVPSFRLDCDGLGFGGWGERQSHGTLLPIVIYKCLFRSQAFALVLIYVRVKLRTIGSVWVRDNKCKER